MSSDLFRLRIGAQIAGYRKQVGSYVFYSRDDFWYNGTVFHFEREEPFIGLKDRRGRKLFVGDVVRCELDGKEVTVRIVGVNTVGPHCCCNLTDKTYDEIMSAVLLRTSVFVGLA